MLAGLHMQRWENRAERLWRGSIDRSDHRHHQVSTRRCCCFVFFWLHYHRGIHQEVHERLDVQSKQARERGCKEELQRDNRLCM